MDSDRAAGQKFWREQADGPGGGRRTGTGWAVEAPGRWRGARSEKYEREGWTCAWTESRSAGSDILSDAHKPAGLLSATEDSGSPPCWICCRSISGGWDCFRWGGWTRIRRVCSSSPTTAHWGPCLSRPRVMWTKCTFVRAAGRLDEEDAAAFRAGMMLGDGLRACRRSWSCSRSRMPALLPCGRENTIRSSGCSRLGKAGALPEKALYGTAGVGPGIVTGGWRLTEEERKRLKELNTSMHPFGIFTKNTFSY